MKLKFIFISYSWDNDEHKAWVKKFSDDLQAGLGAEYEVLLDQNQPKGTDFGLFMQRGITMAEKVMIIGTTKYKEKSQKRLDGGVAYEGSIIREEKITYIATTKFYTILREGTFSTSFPPGLGNTFGDDLSNDDKYDELLPTIVEEIKNPKPISSIFDPDVNDKKNNNNPETILEQDKLSKCNIEQTEYGLIFTIGDISFKMIRVDGGTFMMGVNKQDSEAWEDEKPPHHVSLSPYYIGETVVTQSLWETVMRRNKRNKKNPSCFKGPNKPVENVNWIDCQEFIKELIAITGKEFRLPTEAEWEFAARGGNEHSKYKYSGSDDINEVAWYDHNSYNKGKLSPDYGSHDVKSKNPNELGIYDMSGNVWEWCNDWYDDKYYTISPHTNPQGPQNGNRRVYRGGSWSYNSRRCRVSNRGYFAPGIRYDNLGFRLALSEQQMINYPNKKDLESTEDNDKSVEKNKAPHNKKLEVGITPLGIYNWLPFRSEKEKEISIIGVEFSENKKVLLRFLKDRRGKFIIPNYVDEIADDAFRDCNYLTSIVIPESVTKIGDHAFSGCSSLTSIKIPDSVTEIGERAFSGCSSLTSIKIPDSVTEIGNRAFSGCSSLTSIKIPDSVTEIGEHAFDGCTRLTSIEIPDSVTEIGEHAFSGCSSLTSIEIPDSVTKIGEEAFDGCTRLISIEISESVTVIGGGVFFGCSSLKEIIVDEKNPIYRSKEGVLYSKDLSILIAFPRGKESIEIPDSVTVVGDRAFEDCTSLTSIVIPNSVTEIGIRAFKNCTSLTSIEIPNSVTEIESGAFSGCTSLTSIKIPDGVTMIGERAFFGCTSLTSIEIPKNLTVIGKLAFKNCTSLSSIVIPDSVTEIGECAFWDCTSLSSIVIPDSVIEIGDRAFAYCTSLLSIVIPDSVTVIGSGAFVGCTSLTEIHLKHTSPVDFYEAFKYIELSKITLYVPKGSLKSYKDSGFYSGFNIEEEKS